MGKVLWKPGTMLNPVPAVMISCRSKEGKDNVVTIAWAGTVCSDPPMVSISIRPERFSHNIIKETKEFVINLVNEKLTYKTDYCGVKSGSNTDKIKEMNFKMVESEKVNAPYIEQSPINLECVVKEIIQLGSHDMFLAEVVAVHVDENLIDQNNKLHMDKAKLICYSHGHYYSLKDILGYYGYSVNKKPTKRNNKIKK